MGNNQNQCIKINGKGEGPGINGEDAMISNFPYRQQSFSKSFHYEEGNINFLINSKSSFLKPYSIINNDSNEYVYDDKETTRKFSENPENFEIEIQKILSELSNKLSEKFAHISLDLEGKYVTKKTSLDIMRFFNNAKNVFKLDLNLNNVYLNDEKFATIITSLKGNTEIMELILKISKNHLGYLSGKLISQTLANFLDLKILHIDLSYNPDMSGNGLEELSETFSVLKNLQTLKLDLQATKINSSDLFFLEFKESLSKLPHLIHLSLDLSKNFLKSNILSIFILGLQNLSILQTLSLNLSYNNLKAQDIYDFSSACSELYDLHDLNLVFNECGLSLSEYEILYMGLAKLPNLKRVHINVAKNYNANKIQNFLVDYINPEKSFNSIIDFSLNLSFNLFQDINYENISFVLLSMKNLMFLELSFGNNTLQDKGLENLVCALGRMKFLKSLRLDFKNCDFKNSVFEIMAAFLSHLKSIRSLYLGFATNSCTFQCLLNFFEITQEMFLEKIILEVSEKKIHKEDFIFLIKKLSSFKILKKIDFIKDMQFLPINQRIIQIFQQFLEIKKKTIYQAYRIKNLIKDERIISSLKQKLF